MDVRIRFLAGSVLAAMFLGGCVELNEILADSPPYGYVGEPRGPVFYDPYYNQPKYYPQPYYRQPRYYESTSKKTKQGRVYKTTKIKDEYGNTVYKHTTSKKKKKKN